DLDADVNDALTSWSVPSADGWRPRVTARMLLTHLGGLTVWGFPGYALDGDIASPVDVLAGRGNTPAVRPEAGPGLMWRYSGGGYTVLQQLLADAAGEPFAELARRLVLEPAGMTHSTFEQPLPARLAGDATVAHISMQRADDGPWHAYPELA